jgi:hypothetical protein
MRLLRVLVVATSFAALLAQPSAAQEGRPFKDAWFWGVKGGVLNYSSSVGTDNAGAPMIGADWLITRTHGGLYVSVDQSFFTTTAYYREPYVAGDPYVNVRNLRRISLTAMGFPMQSPTLHPYVGAGLSLNQIGAAGLQSLLAFPAQNAAAADSIQSKKVTFAPMVIAGVQTRLPGFSVFAQGTGTWLQDGFFLHYRAPKRFIQLSLEGGIRYNIGSSIDRSR